MFARAHEIQGVQHVPPLVDDALRVMPGGLGKNLREVFFPWFGELAKLKPFHPRIVL